MKKKINRLKLNYSCQENWEKMSGKTSDRYCDLCQKTVIDLTRLNKQEVLDFFNKYKQACVRITKSQLAEKFIKYDYPTRKKFFIPEILSGLLLSACTGNSIKNVPSSIISASQISVANTDSEVNQPQKTTSPVTNTESTNLEQHKDLLILEGTILNKTDKSPLDSATIYIVNVTGKWKTDKNGHFSIVLPENFTDQLIYITVSKDAYSSDHFEIKRKELPLHNKTFYYEEEIYLGKVIIETED